jgi:hypothetical protein
MVDEISQGDLIFKQSGPTVVFCALVLEIMPTILITSMNETENHNLNIDATWEECLVNLNSLCRINLSAQKSKF